MIAKREIATTRHGVHDITAQVMEVVAHSGVKNGTVVVQTPDAAAGIVTGAPFDEDVAFDVMTELRRIVPARITYRHEASPDAAAGRIKSALFGNSAAAILLGGRPVGDEQMRWYLFEYDGPARRSFYVAVTEDRRKEGENYAER